MWAIVNRAVSAAFDLWLWPMQSLSPAWQIFITALPVTMIALLVFRYASNQDGITEAKNKIKAYLLELWLYKDDIGILLRAQVRVFRYSLIYLRYSLVPMAIMIVPFALIIVQLESEFAYRGVGVGESVILAVTVDSDIPVSRMQATLSVPDGVRQDTPALRSDDAAQVFWRITPDQVGRHQVGIQIGEYQATRQILAGDGRGIWPVAYQAGDWRVLGSAAEPALVSGGGIAVTEVSYARGRAEFIGLSSASWLLLGFSLILGFALRGVFGVTF